MTWTKLHDLLACTPTPFTNAAVIKSARETPEAIVSVDDRGYTPLHIAVSSNPPALEAIKALLNVYPSAVMTKDLHGDTPLHLALHANASLELVTALLQACPNVASERNKEGLMPLHAACRYCSDKKEIIQLLVEANPSALRARTKLGSLVKKKSKVAPTSLVPDENFSINNQHLVLDGAISSSWKSHQIKTSLETQFEERSKQLRDGSYPLHMAITNSAPFPVIEMLINAAPNVLSLTDKFDRTCLHVAVANGATIDSMLIVDPITLQETSIYQPPRTTTEVLELLHSANSKQIHQQDKSKNLPLHTAMQGGCSGRSEDFLIREYPQAVDAKNIDNLTPSELALKYRKE